MLDCPRCGSERIFGGRCLDCGEVLGSPTGQVSTLPAGSLADALAGSHAESGYVAHHVLPFVIPDGLRLVRPRSDVAALNQPTMFSMVKAVRRTDEVEGEEAVEEDAAPTARDLEWPHLTDGGLEPLSALPDVSEVALPRTDAELHAAMFEDSSTMMPRPTAESIAAADGYFQPAEAGLPIVQTPLGTPATPIGPPVKLGEADDPETFGAFPGTLGQDGSVVGPLPRYAPWIILGIVAAFIVALAVALAVKDAQSAQNAVDRFAESAAEPVTALFEGDRITPDALLLAVVDLCGGSPVTCSSARAWVRRSSTKAFQERNGTEAPPADGQPSVIVEAGYAVEIHASGQLFGEAEQEVEHSVIRLAAPDRVQFGEKGAN